MVRKLLGNVTLSEKDRRKVVKYSSDSKFKFGDGKTVDSIKSVNIPAQIRKVEINIQIDVINNELPLLLSKTAMTKADTKIDFTEDKINMLGQDIDNHIEDEKLQYNINREAAKISALPSGKINKYEHLTGQ